MEIITHRPIFLLFDWLRGAPGVTAASVTISFFAVAMVIFVTLPIHEYAHAFSAKILGDDTAERQGRLTLNPFAHIDPVGALILLMVPFGWAKPVPVNPVRCRKVKARTAVVIISAAGPLSNIVLAYIVMIITKITLLNADLGNEMLYYIIMALYLIIQINVYIAIFNLLPVPPLDGSKILFIFLKPKWMYKMMEHQQIISIVFLVLLFIQGSPLRWLLERLSFYMLNGLDFLSGFILRLF